MTNAPWPAPKFRIRVADSFQSQLVQLPIQTPKGSGYLVERFDVDIVLPNIGEAVISRLYGNINGRNYGAPEDLNRKHMIIEKDISVVTLDDPEPTPIWRVEFWGIILGEQRSELPGSTYPAGQVRYHAKGGAWIFTQGRMDLHQWSYLVESTLPSRGHPGYNATADGMEIIGNQDSRSDGFFFIPGHFYAAPWLDSDVLIDCMAAFRYGDWMGTIALGASNRSFLADARVYEVDDKSKPMDIIKQVLDRARTSAVAAIRYTDSEVGATLESLSPTIEIFPSEYADITYTLPSTGGTVTIDGANTAGTAIDLDFTGVIEVNDSDYAETIVSSSLFDAVETVGDRLQCVITAKPNAKWEASEETAYDDFRAANPTLLASGDPRFADVFSRVGWASGGPLSARNRADSADVSIDFDTSTDTAEIIRVTDYISNPQVVNLVDDLPLLVGYDYWTTTTISGRGANETSVAALMPWQAWESDGAGRYVDLTEADSGGLGMSRGQSGNDIIFTGGGTSGKPLENVDLDNLRVTVCVELPSRLRLTTGDTEGRVKRIDAAGNKLSFIDSGAIIALDFDDQVDGYSAALYPSVNSQVVTNPTSAIYIVRDDRDTMAAIHAQAVTHHTTPRRTVEFTVRGAYGPRWNGVRCGVVINQLTANGETRQVNTPITRISYDARQNTTRVSTDFVERRWRV